MPWYARLKREPEHRKLADVAFEYIPNNVYRVSKSKHNGFVDIFPIIGEESRRMPIQECQTYFERPFWSQLDELIKEMSEQP